MECTSSAAVQKIKSERIEIEKVYTLVFMIYLFVGTMFPRKQEQSVSHIPFSLSCFDAASKLSTREIIVTIVE